ncbi:redox-regulated ATPase YchF [Candidatus Jorgensenbacteria bacterium CG10_big_fil_rev_8_21_14_0_10_54_38]|uniref:Redox-regulated ATPase YchF n=2 Tax=Candidatus Joergenseniibacteriota TaxID=1752739 RepID=A0A2M6WFT8_9BACT|nr:MAG: redox-regulated ATPase YchF [Candidatus Jorgensenbacteria bacterium CG23_combo_of_CG06-09_8_20_14_all_54_14]PIT91627.1 MAG: redox-regulated ATPase YchF [Candidatus Jorgensenbacteria bacterium CG10_big_fil_rev_8_21_14_0_10_54_38]
MGIVGLPNVGKSTLFKILTRQEVHIANYPFATIDPNVGVVLVPDERVQKLAALTHSKKVVPAVVEFYDIAGLVKGSHKGEGLGNQFLAHIRECRAIVQVVRCFGGSEIVHVEGTTDPLRDMDTIETELSLKDLETVSKRLEKAEGEARGGDKTATHDRDALRKVKEAIGGDYRLRKSIDGLFAHEEVVRNLQLLSAKKQIMLLNGKQEDVGEALLAKIKEMGADYLVADLAEADAVPTPFGGEPLRAVEPLIKKAYEVLGLVSFFTTGEDETRAWTIERGTKAPQAAGVIHTDFEKNFIRAEVVNWEKLLEAGGWAQAKQKGWLRLEGKEYIVEDGDVMVIRHG